jgi:hypothetical protein
MAKHETGELVREVSKPAAPALAFTSAAGRSLGLGLALARALAVGQLLLGRLLG